LTFWHRYSFELRWDGGMLWYSTTDATSGYQQVPDSDPGAGPYISSPSYDDTLRSACEPGSAPPAGTEIWTDSQGWEQVTVDLTDLAGETLWLVWRAVSDCLNFDEGWLVDAVRIEATYTGVCTDPSPGPVEYLTVRSTHQTNDLQWMTPDVGMYGRTRICWDTSSFPSDPDACASSHDDTATGQGAHASWSHSGLSNDVTYRYAVWADDGNDATSDWSSVTQVTGRPENTSDPANPVHWVYTTTASSLAPPGIGSAYAVSNDRVLHSVVDGSSGGTWPAAWEPVPMNAPSQQRPAVVVFDDTPGPSGAAKVVFMSSQDGRVYAADADSGAVLWTSVDLGMVQAAPSAIFSEFGGAHDLVFVGTRNALSDNRLVALNVSDGSTAWEFENSAAQGGDGTGIGIISGQPAVSYATNRVYFTSRERAGGSADTVWCLSFTGNGVDDVQLEWSQAAGSIDAGPSMRDGVVYVGTNDSEVHAFDASGGAALWATPFDCSDGPIKGFPWLRSDPGGTLLFLSTTSTVWRLQDGGSSPSCAWSTSAHPQCPVTAPSVGSPSVPLLVPGTNDLLVGSSDGRLHQLSISDGSASASPLVLGDGTAVVGSPSLDTRNDLAYVGTEAGSLYAVTAPFSKKGGALR
jgi:outer membrane protein assembly factor BamB